MSDFRDKVVYQIYPKSFYDSNQDGFGDIKGITLKLDYLKQLGVDYIWSTPFFLSPQNDNGYDVADYCKIDPRYGTMEDLEELIEEADKRNIGLMFDMVFNHTSTEHIWFQKAMSGDEYYKEFYLFRDGKDGDTPTNWISKFGGSAWEYAEKWKQYYLHLFDKTQADLNWENPNVRKELIKVLKFWIEKGVKGFRFDVINLISKPEIMQDDSIGDGRLYYTDGPKVDEYLKEICRESGITEKHLLTVGEMSSTTLERCATYSKAEEEELSMCFNFHHLKVDYKDNQKWEMKPFDFEELKSLFHEWQVGMQEKDGWNALFWNNHDQPRAVSRFCNDEKYLDVSAKMLAGCIHMMRGTPYIYQGEEIGMTNANFTDISQYRDVESLNYFNILQEKGKSREEAYEILRARSRDNSRTPMQWDNIENAGFSQVTPWLEANKNYHTIHVEAELEKEDSIFQYYVTLIQMRKQYEVISKGRYQPLLIKHKQVFAYQRYLEASSLLAFHNFFEQECTINLSEFDLDGYECILSNYEKQMIAKKMQLKPFESIVFYKAKTK